MLTDQRVLGDRTGERGSVVIAAMALMLLLLIGSAVLVRGRADLRAVDANADGLSAQASAERGVAEVLARLDGGETGDFSDSGTSGDGAYRYRATQISSTEYLVQAEGAVDGLTYEVQVTIGRQPPTAYTLFVAGKAAITDNGGTISGRVGTNGPLDVSGTPLGDSLDLHGPDARCDGCGRATVFDDPLALTEPAAPLGRTQDCPGDGVFSGVVDGNAGMPYVCTTSNVRGTDVQFTGVVTIANPPLIVHVDTGLDISLIDASINERGRSEEFQLTAEGTSDAYWRLDTWNSSVQGLIDAPGRRGLFEATSIIGSVTIGVLEIRSPHDVWIAPPAAAIEPSASAWSVTSWERRLS